MKNILLIEPFCPIPTDSGGKVRILNTIKYLSQKYKISILSFFQNENEKPALSKLVVNSTFVKLGPKNNFSPIPYWFSDWYSKEVKKHLQLTDFSNFESVIVEFSQLLYIVDFLPTTVNTIFVSHDVSTVSYWRRLHEVSLFKKIIHLIRFVQIYLYERKYLPKYKTVVAVSDIDAKILKKLFNLNNIVVVPNGIESVNFINKTTNSPPTLGYLGSTSHSPNKKAIDFIVSHISPLTSSNIIIAGSNDSLQFSEKQNVQFKGFIPNTKDFYQQIDILVAPIFSGSGSRIKILESLSYGIPVITTTIGAEGLDINSPYLFIVKEPDKPENWITAINSIYSNINANSTSKLKNQLSKYLWSTTLSLLLPLPRSTDN